MRTVSLGLLAWVFVVVAGCSEAASSSVSTEEDAGSAAANPASSNDVAEPGAGDAAPARPDAADSSVTDASDASASPAPIGDGGTCNALAQQSPADVNLITSTAAAPPALGGAIVDGTYVLVSATRHFAGGTNGDIAGSYGKLTRDIAGSLTQGVRTTPVQTKQFTQTLATSGTAIDLIAVCAFPPAVGPASIPTTFTATPTTLTLYETQTAGIVVELAYTKL